MADHLDAPGLMSPNMNAKVDITDIYAFRKPGDPHKSILIMNVNPLAPTLDDEFDDGAAYDLQIDTDGDAVAEIAFRFTFADSHTISGYGIHGNGKISLLNSDGVTGSTPSDTFPLEEGLSRNSRFLYVLDSRLLNMPPGPATLSGFLIHRDGSLTTVIDPSQFTLPFTTIGLAAE